jgi:hypothetical protein
MMQTLTRSIPTSTCTGTYPWASLYIHCKDANQNSQLQFSLNDIMKRVQAHILGLVCIYIFFF